MISLKPYHTFRAECMAEDVITLHTPQDLEKLIQSGFFGDHRWIILGEGSNILFRSHFPGVALINNMK
jgi:UDP-N-acetylenolpyruvoylglucosamine reductase